MLKNSTRNKILEIFYDSKITSKIKKLQLIIKVI